MDSKEFSIKKTKKLNNFIQVFNSVAYTDTLIFSLQCVEFFVYYFKYYRKSIIFYGNYFLGVDIKIKPLIGEHFYFIDYLDLIMVCAGVLFVLSTLISFFNLSYLGLEGVFKLNFKTLLFF